MFSLVDSLTLTAAFGSFLLGIIALVKDPKKLINLTFSIFSFTTVLWIMSNFVFSFYKIKFILQSQYALGSLIMPIALIWVFVLIDNRITKKRLVAIISVATFAFLVSFTRIFISDLIINNGSAEVIAGPLFEYYSIFILCIFVFFISNLILGITKSSGTKKIQLKLVLFGSLTFGGISMITSFILPFSNWIPVGPYDAQSSLFFVAFSAYAIFKHKLFDLKVIATELLIGTIWLFLLVRILLSVTVTDIVVSLTFFVLMLLFGLLLMKSVVKEVDAREHIEHLAQDLQKANDRLRELDRQKSEFVSFATHQLRAPLTAMKGYASLILEGDMGEISEETRMGVSRIYDSTNTLVSIVNDYLNVSRIELGSMKYAFEKLDFKKLVEEVIAELKPNIDKAKVEFSFDASAVGDGCAISADKDKFKQVIANLIDNSLKYTPSGFVKVSLKKDQATNKIVFEVKDSGVGIAPEVLPKLFQKFTRAENANKINIRGTGLGLYVARQIALAHHSDIKASSPGEGKGSTFTVEVEEVK